MRLKSTQPNPQTVAFLTLEQAGQLLGVGRCRAWELARTGQLPSIRFGKRWLVPRRALEALIDRAIVEAEQRRKEAER